MRLALALLSVLLHWAGSATAEAQVAVQARPYAEVAIAETHRAAARVLPRHDSLLAAETAAVVLAVHAEAGAEVAAGALLVELDATDARLARDQAAAQLSAAQARHELAGQRLRRAEELHRTGHLSADGLLAQRTEATAAEAEVQLTRQALAIAARQVAKCSLRAPFAGVVAERMAQVGSLAVPGTPLLRLVQTGDAEVEAHLATGAAAAVEAGAATALEVDGKPYPLRLLRLSPILDRATRTRLVRLAFAGPGVPEGSTGSLRVTVPRSALPAEFAVQRDGVTGVFVVEAGSARFVPVPGASPGRILPLTLPDDSLVVVTGQQALSDGADVRLRVP